jgi:hypothetical protein
MKRDKYLRKFEGMNTGPEAELAAASIPKERGLVVASGRKIYCAELYHSTPIAERSDTILDIVYHNGVLYDVGFHAVYDTMTGRTLAEGKCARALTVHDGVLYAGGWLGDVFELLSGKEISKDNGHIWALASHDGILYDGRAYHQGQGHKRKSTYLICETLKTRRKIRAQRHRSISSLAVHDGRLYDAGNYGVYETLGNSHLAQRETYSIASHKGMLLDGGGKNEVFSTFGDPNGTNPMFLFNRSVSAMASVPIDMWEELIRRKGQSK